MEEQQEELKNEVRELEEENQQQQPQSEGEVVVEVKPELGGFRKRLAEHYKDSGEDFSNDEVYEKFLNKYADDSDAELKRYHDADNSLREIFDTYPEFKELITDIAVNKVPPRIAISRQWSTEDLTPQSGDDDYEQYVKEFYDRKERNKKQKDFEDELYKNLNESNGKIDAYIKAKGYTDDQKKALVELMDKVFDKSFKGITDDEVLDMFSKALMFDSAVEQAKAVGELKGRNDNIEAKLETNEQSKKGDGLPTSNSFQHRGNENKEKKPIINMGSILSRYK